MTDLESFVELYRRFGIECVVNHEGDYQVIKLLYEHHYDGEYNEVIIDKPSFTTSPLFKGCSGFYTAIYFDVSGKFIKQEFLE